MSATEGIRVHSRYPFLAHLFEASFLHLDIVEIDIISIVVVQQSVWSADSFMCNAL